MDARDSKNKMYRPGGTIQPPAQKLVATILSIEDGKTANLLESTKKSHHHFGGVTFSCDGRERFKKEKVRLLKSLAEFAAQAANKVSIIFCRGVYLAENTHQAASVEFLRRRRRNYARSRLQKPSKSPKGDFRRPEYRPGGTIQPPAQKLAATILSVKGGKAANLLESTKKPEIFPQTKAPPLAVLLV